MVVLESWRTALATGATVEVAHTPGCRQAPSELSQAPATESDRVMRRTLMLLSASQAVDSVQDLVAYCRCRHDCGFSDLRCFQQSGRRCGTISVTDCARVQSSEPFFRLLSGIGPNLALKASVACVYRPTVAIFGRQRTEPCVGRASHQQSQQRQSGVVR